MERAEQLFVEAVSVSLENKSVSWKEPLTLNEWQRIFYLAESHHVLPMVYETVFRCDAVKKTTQKEIKDTADSEKKYLSSMERLEVLLSSGRPLETVLE